MAEEQQMGAFAQSMKIRTKAAADYVDEGRKRLEQIGTELRPVFDRYFDFMSELQHKYGRELVPGRFHCAAKYYELDQNDPWIETLIEKGFYFSHDCLDHGYDYSDIESIILPHEYVQDPSGFEYRRRAQCAEQADAIEKAKERQKTDQRSRDIAELKRLQALYPEETAG